jgi:uncharacterized protein (DUF885 family)
MTDFESFSLEYHEHFTRDANECVRLGVNSRLDELPDPGNEERDARLRDATRLVEYANRLAQEPLCFDDSLDLDLARLALAAELHSATFTWAGQTHAEQCPTAGEQVGDGLFLLFVNDPRPAEQRLGNIKARLDRVPEFLEAYGNSLGRPVARWLRMDLEKVAALPSLFATLEGWARQRGWADAKALAASRAAAESALDRYAERLHAMPVHEDVHIGEETASRIVGLRGIEQDLDSLHAMATDFLAENRREVEELRGRLVRKYDLPPDATAEDLQRLLNRRFALPIRAGQLDDVLQHYENEREKVLAFVREHELFPVPVDQEMKIIRTPEFMTPTIPAGAMMPPPPFRSGTATSMIYLTLSDELLEEHTALSVPSMMIHEGIPGHHLHLAGAAGHASVIRRHFWAPEQAEGWTTMLEDYMLDVGYAGDFADEQRFIGKRDIARIGARVAIDLFFMTGERDYLDVGVDCDRSSPDPFEAAGALLEAVTGFVGGRVQAELNWYSQERGYPLSYLTGNRLVWKLKRDVEAALSGRIEGLAADRLFHRVYLEAGSMPLSFMRRVYEEKGIVNSR